MPPLAPEDCRLSRLSRFDATLRALVNSTLRQADAYSTLKLALLLFCASKLLRALRKVWMHRAAGVQGLVQWVVKRCAPMAKQLPFVRAQLSKEMVKLRADLEKDVTKELTAPCAILPPTGQSESALLELMRMRHGLDSNHWLPGKTTGAIYHGDLEYMAFVGQVYGMFAFTNPLHSKLHPSTRQMESEVIAMVLRMYNAPSDACGAFTTGGTESILMAIKSYRDYARATRGVTQPNFVACTTAHAAFDKAAHFFGVELRHAGYTADMEIDLAQVRRLVDSNTICLVGSAPQYAHGTIDDIPALSKLARAKGIGLHVDCCLGGFLLPFMERAGFSVPHPYDFRVEGVTTVSCDPHKYGFAPKGSSILMFRQVELRHHMYTYATDWSGGIYATPTILGSRPGGVVAATWCAMMRHGVEGYTESTRRIVGATRHIGDAIATVDGLKLVGRPDVCVVAFTGSDESINCYSMCDALKQLGGWEMATLQKPAAVHLAVTLPSSRNAAAFVSDLEGAVQMLRAEPDKWKGGSAGLYGTLSKLPPAFLEESAKVFLDTMTLCAAEEGADGETKAAHATNGVAKSNGHHHYEGHGVDGAAANGAAAGA